MFTARYAPSPSIKQIRLVFKRLNSARIPTTLSCSAAGPCKFRNVIENRPSRRCLPSLLLTLYSLSVRHFLLDVIKLQYPMQCYEISIKIWSL